MQSESDSPEFWSQRSVFACVSAVVFKLVGFVERTAERCLIWDCLGMHVQLRQTAKQLEAASYKWNMGILHRFGLQGCSGFCLLMHAAYIPPPYGTEILQHYMQNSIKELSCCGLWAASGCEFISKADLWPIFLEIKIQKTQECRNAFIILQRNQTLDSNLGIKKPSYHIYYEMWEHSGGLFVAYGRFKMPE